VSDMLKVSSSPHVRAKDTTDKIMLYVILALLPASLFGVYNFGLRALILIVITILSCMASEWIFEKITKRPNTLKDLSAVVTGLLLALNLPVSLPYWQAVLGGVFAIIVVKMLFGGLGQNFMNPALGARCFLLISFTGSMTAFTYDGVSTATPLALLKSGEQLDVTVMDMLIGKTAGTIGETSAIAILIGAIFLILMGVIDLRIPASYIITFTIFILFFGGHGFDWTFVTAQLCGGAVVRRRIDAGGVFYGDRLCDVSDYAAWSDCLWYYIRTADGYFPYLRRKCRRRILCDYFQQPVGSAD